MFCALSVFCFYDGGTVGVQVRVRVYSECCFQGLPSILNPSTFGSTGYCKRERPKPQNPKGLELQGLGLSG